MNYTVDINWGFSSNWREFKDFVKGIPGVKAEFSEPPERVFKCWKVPLDVLAIIEKEARRLDITLKNHHVYNSAPLSTISCPRHPQAKPYQLKTADIMAAQRRWILNDPMGFGKTATTILALRGLNVTKIIIVCPAAVRDTWVDELNTWWPEHPEIGVIEYGLGRKLSKKLQAAREESYSKPCRIVSYNLVSEIGLADYEGLVLDEAHRLKNPGAGVSQYVHELCRAVPNAAVFALTGTLLPDKPKDAWHVVDLLWPGRWGEGKNNKHPWGFLKRYMNEVVNEDPETGEIYGTDWSGLREKHADEFRTRIQAVSSRTTKAEGLPPFAVRLLKVNGQQKGINTFADLVASQEELSAFSNDKIPHVLEWAQDALEGATHICVLTHRKALAKELADKLFARTGVQVTLLTGEMLPAERNIQLKAAAQQDSAIVVATMQSVEEGINGLANFTAALFAEMHMYTKVMIQAAKRFNRLSSREAAVVDILCVRDTADERQAALLARKLKDINNLVQAGDSEEKLEAAFRENDDKLSESLDKMLASNETEY